MNQVRQRMAAMMILSLIFSVQGLIAQAASGPTAVIGGIVRNISSREPLAGVNVSIVGTTLGTVTDSAGRFQVSNVPPGTWGVRVSAIGFGTVIQGDVVANPVKETFLEIRLQEADISLGEVSVTADYFARNPDIPVSTQSQSYEEIRRLPGGLEDVVRAVSILPGVAQVQAGRNDLIIRGGAPSENLFVLDNLEVPNINHFGTQGASGGPLSYINLDYVSATTFSTGGFGVRYGDKLSSVLTIDLKDGRRDRFGGKATLSATQFGLNAEGPLSDKGSIFATVRRSYLDFIFKAAGFGFVPEYWDAMVKATYQIGERDQISLLGVGVLDNIRLFNDTRDKIYDNSKILLSDQDQAVAGITLRHLFTTGFVTVSAGQLYTRFGYSQNDTLLNPIFESRSVERTTSLRGDLVMKMGTMSEFALGVQGSRLRNGGSLRLNPFWTNYGSNLSIDSRFDSAGYKAGAYGQWSQGIGRLHLTGGVRWDYYSLINEGSVIAPRLASTFALAGGTNLNASVGRYYQTPSFVWLVSNPVNRNLKQISADQIVVGFDHLIRTDTRVSLEGYRKKYRDYPVSLSQPFLIMANTGAGYGGSEESFASFGIDSLQSSGIGDATGLELSVQKKLSEIPCYGIFSLSYNETRFTAIDGIERPGSFDQRWILNIGGGYLFDERWEASMKFRFATGRPYTPYNPDGTQSAAGYNSARVGTNHSLDLRVDRRWFFAGWTLITYVDIQNVYSRKPVDVPRYNERLGRVEDDDALGILPSIGVSAEF